MSIQIDMNQKFIEMLGYLIINQNYQLLKIIAKEEGINFNELKNKYLITRTQFHDMLNERSNKFQSSSSSSS